MAEYVTCPNCGLKVLTADTLVGRSVRCFGCDSRFLANPDPDPPPAAPRPAAPPRPAARAAPALRDRDFVLPAPPRYVRNDDEEAFDQPLCPACGARVSWAVAGCPVCKAEFEAEDGPPASRPVAGDGEPVRRDGAPHRGPLLFRLAAFSVIGSALSACCLGWPALVTVPVGATVWVLASRDLRGMADGSVDPRGRNRTRDARSTAIAGVAFGVLVAGVFLLFLWAR